MGNTHDTLTSLFADIANSIRQKTGDTAQIVADNFPDAIELISGGGGGDLPLPSGWTYDSASFTLSSEPSSATSVSLSKSFRDSVLASRYIAILYCDKGFNDFTNGHLISSYFAYVDTSGKGVDMYRSTSGTLASNTTASISFRNTVTEGPTVSIAYQSARKLAVGITYNVLVIGKKVP